MYIDISNYLFIIQKDVIRITNNTELDIPGANKQPYKFYSTVLRKILSHLDGTAHIFLFIEDRVNLFNSLFLLHRTALLDIINVYYILIAQGNEMEQLERIDGILNDHIHSIYKNSNAEDKDRIRKTFSNCFKDGKPIGKKISTNEMVLEISKTMFIDEIKQAHFYYKIYSKMEHNGYYTDHLLNIAFQEPLGIKQPAALIFHSIRILLLGIFTVLENTILKNEDSKRIELTNSINAIFALTEETIAETREFYTEN